MSDIFDIHEMSEEDIKHEYITTALEAKWDAKKNLYGNRNLEGCKKT